MDKRKSIGEQYDYKLKTKVGWNTSETWTEGWSYNKVDALFRFTQIVSQI